MNNKVKLHKSKESGMGCAKIHALSHDGRGIALVNKKTTFIEGALPNETVSFKLTQKRSHFNEANMLEVIEGSSERATPPCAHFGLCGGCSLQHMQVDTQIKLKEQTLLEQLKHFGKVEPERVLPPLSAQSEGYRRKARLGAKFVIKKNKMLVGFREKSSRYLADLEECVILHPKVGKALVTLREKIFSLDIHRHIPQVEIAIGDQDAALIFRHMEPLSINDQEKLTAFGKEHQFHIYLQPNAPAPVSRIWPETGEERLTYSLPDHQLTFMFHPLDFTQINLELNRLMVNQALRLLDLNKNEEILDLFCGIGNFTLPIARYAKQVIGIEGSMEMVKRAKANAEYNGLTNTAFLAENLDAPNPASPWLKATYHKILLDPPRAGAKALLPFIHALGAKRILYVSCNPATLARDAGELVHQYGYKLTQAGVMNMFPHTSHIEAMAVFDK